MGKVFEKIGRLFSSHYGIERFAVLFIALSVGMAACIGTILYKISGDRKEQLGTQAVYTTAFAMSVSRATGSVVSVNTNEANTRCLVLLKYDDPSKMATNADAYSMFLTGVDLKLSRKDLESAPMGSVFVFGNSGYVALYLIDMNGFPSQIMDLTLRSDNPFKDSQGPIEDSRGDASFTKYDQARIYFNPGADDAQSLSCLEKDGSMDPYDIYRSVMTESREQDLRDQLEAKLVEMQEAQNHIVQAERTVEDRKLQVPSRPTEIAMDSIQEDENGNLVLIDGYPLPGSHNFDWRNGSIEQGYMDDVLAASGYASASDYFAAKKQEAQSAPQSLNTSSVVFYNANGDAKQPMTAGDMSTAEKLDNDAMNSLLTAWNDFYRAKYAYTITLPGQLLDLEVESKEITSNFTVRNDTDVLRIY